MFKTINVLLLAGFLGTTGYAFVWNTAGERETATPAPWLFVAEAANDACPEAQESSLPLPGATPRDAYEAALAAFLEGRVYDTALHWCVDKSVRDTGPWIDSTYYGTHPAVRIYYSPKMMYWLTGDPAYWSGARRRRPPRTGAVPDGAFIVKEMFDPPAARYDGMTDADLADILLKKKTVNGDYLSSGWTIMVKDAAGSKDGWFWGSWWLGPKKGTFTYPFLYPSAGFGQDCLRCHTAAEAEFTFSALRNVKGFPGSPVTFWVDDTWKNLPDQEYPAYEHAKQAAPSPPAHAPVQPDPGFLDFFSTITSVPYDRVRKFPSEDYDRVVAGPDEPEQYLSSDQCMMCHSGHSGVLGPVMFLQTEPGFGNGVNVSPYGEWRWSPMGLAGRDPIFHAQLESEVALLKRAFADDPAARDAAITATVNTCLSCHGVMGKRQYDLDQGNQPVWGADFHLDWIYATSGDSAKYGGLARDGISCTTCHHVKQEYKALDAFLMNGTTGQFTVGAADTLYGPFEDVTPFPMDNMLGATPTYDPYVKSSRLCGSCHTINLPVVDDPLAGRPPSQLDRAEKNPTFKPFVHHIEQATYLEWLNSEFQNEVEPWNKQTAQRCQDCHMPGGYHAGGIDIAQIQTKIADIEDQEYPEADHRASRDSIYVRFRTEGYARHKFQGLNVYLMEVFNQFNDVLGVRTQDYFSGSYGLTTALENYVAQARQRTATVAVTTRMADDRTLMADVTVANLTGHRFPSGVGFRRMFIEFMVIDSTGGRNRVVWSSGRTNALGLLVDGEGKVLPTELLDGPQYQPHYQTITAQNQVQIYEELSQNAQGAFTTSFIHRDTTVKDNRLLPRGWKRQGPDPALYPSIKAYIDATHPEGQAAADPDYGDRNGQGGLGRDRVSYTVTLPDGVDPTHLTVQATLYSQSIPPYYLNQRFTGVAPGPEGDARRRLYYLTSNLKVDGTPIENWKLKLVSARARVAGG